LKSEVHEDLNIITNFEVKVFREDGNVHLESSGASKSILPVIEAFQREAKRIDRASESVQSLVLRDNSGPVSLPVFITGISNCEMKYIVKGTEEFSYLGDDIEELVITRTMLSRITKHINLLKNLIKLDISNNCIQEITDQIELPLLQELNLSSNHLKSLDFLQALTSLKSLDASNNSLHTLHTSVHMLVPQSATLSSIDLSGNPVCEDLNYCAEIVSVFPKLHRFDGRILYDLFVETWRVHTSINSSFTASDAQSLDFASVIGADEGLKFEVRLRRALKQRFRGMSREQIKAALYDREFKSMLPGTSHSNLDQFLIDALKIDPNNVNCIVPAKKPLQEVASYMKGILSYYLYSTRRKIVNNDCILFLKM